MALESTLCIIKPDCVGRKWLKFSTRVETDDEGNENEVEFVETLAEDKSEIIIQRIHESGFTIKNKLRTVLSVKQAKDFYREHEGKPFYDELVHFMTSGPIVALELQKEDAIASWRDLLGNTDSEKARANEEISKGNDFNNWGIRASFGTDKTRNACHGSDSQYSAARELKLFFPDPVLWERTFALIMTDEFSNFDPGAILNTIEELGFVVCASRSAEFTDDLVRAFYSHFEGKPEYDELLATSLGRPVMAVALEGFNSIHRWTQAIGPVDCSQGIRKRYTNGTEKKSLFYGSPTKEAAAHELDVWFPDGIESERTFALVLSKDSDSKFDRILHKLHAHNFSVVASKQVEISKTKAERLFQSSPHSVKLRALASNGKPSVAMVLSKPGAVKGLKFLKKNLIDIHGDPDSLEAEIGSVLMYSADSLEIAKKQIRILFPNLPFLSNGIKDVKAAKNHLMKRKAQLPPFESIEEDAGVATFQGILTDGLIELCRQKPHGLDAVKKLGEWLLLNNPNTEAAERARAEITQATASRKESNRSRCSGEIKIPSSSKPQVIFVLGAPGSGKRDQCDILSKSYNFVHLKVGDIMKAEVDSGSETGKEILETVSKRELVDSKITISLLRKAMKRSKSNKFLIDGFPRDMEQAMKFEKEVCPCDFVISFECPDETIIERELQKTVSSDNGVAENSNSLKQRLLSLRERSNPVLQHYRNLGKLYYINSVFEPARVFEKVHSLIEPDIIFVLGGPGVGKASICTFIENEYSYTRLRVSDILREEARKGTEEGRRIQRMLRNGESIPNNVIISLLKRTIVQQNSNKFILDGFPRNIKQCTEFESTVASAKFALHLSASQDTLYRRAKPGQDSLRFKKKFKLYKDSEMAVVENFRSQGRLREVRTDGCTLEQVVREIQPCFQQEVIFAYGTNSEYVQKQCQRVMKEFGYTLLSLGLLVDSEILQESEFGALLADHKQKDEVIPIELKINVLKHAMARSQNSKFLLQGFPITTEEIKHWEEAEGKPSQVLHFKFEQVEDALIDDYYLGGIVRQFDCMNSSFDQVTKDLLNVFRVNLICVVGKGSFSPSETSLLVSQLAAEQGYVTIDSNTALKDSPNSCPGTWFNAIIARENGYVERPIVRSEEQQLIAEEEVRRAQLALLENAAEASGKRGIILVGFPQSCEDVTALTSRLGKPKAIIELRCPSNIIRQKLADENPATEAVQIDALLGAHEHYLEQNIVPVVGAFRNAHPSVQITHISTVGDNATIAQRVRSQFQAEIIVLIGSEGVWKKEVCTVLAKERGYVRLVFADLLSEEIRRGTSNGRIIEKHLIKNRSVPLEVSIPVIRAAARATGKSKLILDGYPRVVGDGYPFIHDQVFALEQKIGPVKAVLHLAASDESRRTRMDVESVSKTVEVYTREQIPAIGFFTALGKVAEIDANAEFTEVYHRCVNAIDSMEKKAEAAVQLGCWAPGDGSPQALLQEVIDCYNPNRESLRTAEAYFNQFKMDESGNLVFGEVQEKVNEWGIEVCPMEGIAITDKTSTTIIPKHEWFRFIFKSVLLLDPLSEKPDDQIPNTTAGEAEETKEVDS